MQKYWHKGAFFQEEADDKRGTAGPEQIYRRDFSAPTGEDVFDKTILPKVMQVRQLLVRVRVMLVVLPLCLRCW